MTTRPFDRPSLRPLIRLAGGALCLAALLAGCGGGGGGGEAAVPGDGVLQPAAAAVPVNSQSRVAVTTDNAKALAAEALDSATRTTLLRALLRLPLQVDFDPAAPTGIVPSGPVDCRGGGSLNLAGTTGTPEEITKDVTLVLTAADCTSGLPGVESFSGRLDIAVTAGTWRSMVAYDRHPRSVDLAVRTSDFRMRTQGESLSITGDLALQVGEIYQVPSRLQSSGTAFTWSTSTANGRRSVTLRNYQRTTVVGGGSVRDEAQSENATSNARVAATPVSYVLATQSALSANAAGVFTAGSLKVTGERSSLLLTVTGPDQFRIEIDRDGDGTNDASLGATLAELRALL